MQEASGHLATAGSAVTWHFVTL